MENAGFWFLMIGLKLPIFLLFYLLYKAINDVPEPDRGDDDGGIQKPRSPRPRRGPHGGQRLPSPPRVRKPERQRTPASLR